jgi:AcrR family transcriptional regulator
MKKSDKRGDIVQAAFELIAAKGFHGAPMSEIAEKAGVAAGTIYRYFSSKDDLIAAIYQALEETMRATIVEESSDGRPVRERFLALQRASIKYFVANPLHFRFMEQFYNSPYGDTMRRDNLLGKPGKHNLLIDIFSEGIAKQILKDFPLPIVFSLATGPLMFLMRDHIFGFITLDDALVERTTEACWDAIRR